MPVAIGWENAHKKFCYLFKFFQLLLFYCCCAPCYDEASTFNQIASIQLTLLSLRPKITNTKITYELYGIVAVKIL
jgi:hypothetical protein